MENQSVVAGTCGSYVVTEQFWFSAAMVIKEATLDTAAQRYTNTHTL